MAEVAFRCACGTVTGLLHDVGPAAAQGTRADCSCADCRGAVRWLGQALREGAPVGYYQTTPDRVEIVTGAERLAAFEWRRPGFLRWYASCCGTPLFNTPGTPGVPFTSAYVMAIPDPAPLGPVTGHAFRPKPGGGTHHEGGLRFAWGMLRRTIPARLSGRWKRTPFFDAATGRPVAPPRRLTDADRTGTRTGAAPDAP